MVPIGYWLQWTIFDRLYLYIAFTRIIEVYPSMVLELLTTYVRRSWTLHYVMNHLLGLKV